MKPEHKDLSPTDLALLTWYKPDSDKYRDPLHPTLKLAGEIGELLDLYAKHEFKPGFDWTNCKWCNQKLSHHDYDSSYCTSDYTPLVLDELGDIWYYLRITAWIYNVELVETKETFMLSNLSAIKVMYQLAPKIFNGHRNLKENIEEIFKVLTEDLLPNLDCTLSQLTELNYHKLNSEPTNHGWEDAR